MLVIPVAVSILYVNNASAQNLLVNGDFNDTTGMDPFIPTAPGDVTAYWSDFTPEVPGWHDALIGTGYAFHGNLSFDYSNVQLSPGWLTVDEGVGAFVDHGLSSGVYGGLNVYSNESAAMCQTVATNIGTDYVFSGLVSNPSTDNAEGEEVNANAKGLVYYSTLLGGVEVSSNVVVATVYDQDTISFSQVISQASGAFDSIEVCYSIESLDGGSSFVAVDGFSLTAVPEASSAILLGLGSLGLLARRKRVYN